MKKIAASVLATAFAVVMLGGSAMADLQRPEPSPVAATESTPLESTPLGLCRIHYDALPDESQPAAMECEHAEWTAQRWGGQVLEKTGQGLIQRAVFVGRNDFSGVPASALPRPGYCRAWIESAAVETQPAESDCRTARRLAEAQNGRVIFMPL